MNRGELSTLIVLGGNPVYNAPVDLKFSEALKKVEHTIQLSEYADETSTEVEWHINQAQYLERWGDAGAVEGSVSIIQPMIEPLYGGHSAIEVMNLIVTGQDQGGYDIIRAGWTEILKGKDFEKEWRRALHDGVLAGSGLSSEPVSVDWSAIESELKSASGNVKGLNAGNMEIVFAASPAVFDGRFANIGWLQELPDAITKLTWDNPALISSKTAKELGLESGDMARLAWQGNEVEMPIWILPGHADYSVTVMLGYGRKAAGRIGNGVGFDTYRLRKLSNRDFGEGLSLTATGEKYKLSTTQDHQSMEGRPLIRERTLAEYRRRPNFAAEMVALPKLESIFTEHQYDRGYQWGMAIDLNVCTGCNACTIACQSENNISIVGKEQVSRGREMHWIRIDRYFAGDVNEAESGSSTGGVPTLRECPLRDGLSGGGDGA